MNEFLSNALALANKAIFLLVAIGVSLAVYDGSLEFWGGVAACIAAAVACGVIATLIVIKERLQAISYQSPVVHVTCQCKGAK